MSKPVSPQLKAILNRRQFFRADLYTFVLANNLGTLRYCSGDADIKANGFLYGAGLNTGPYFDRRDNKAKINQSVGFDADQLIFDVIPGGSKVFGVPFLHACRIGIFDGATMTLETAFMPTYGDTRAGTVARFSGKVTELDFGRSTVTFGVNSWMELLNLTFPRNLFTPGCINNLGDASCTVNIESFKTTGTVAAGSQAGLIAGTFAGGPFSAGTFDQGKILFTSGVLSGFTQTVKKCTFGSPNVVLTNGEFPFAPTIGDTFKIYYGCDKSPGLLVSASGFTNGTTAVIDQIDHLPTILPGMFVTGTGVPAGAFVLALAVALGDTQLGQILLSHVPTFNGTQQFTFQSPSGCARFSNQANYRGFPRIPQPVYAI